MIQILIRRLHGMLALPLLLQHTTTVAIVMAWMVMMTSIVMLLDVSSSPSPLLVRFHFTRSVEVN